MLKSRSLSRATTRLSSETTIAVNPIKITYPAHIPHDPHFVGRQDLLEQMEAYLSDHSACTTKPPPSVVLVAMPGMGKTSLAKRFIQSCESSYDYVFLLSAETEPKLLQDFKNVSRLLGLQNDIQEGSVRDACGPVIHHLVETGTC